jgi:hypothetical protein
LKIFYSHFKAFFLRGAAKRWWIRYRARQIDRAFLEEITSAASSNPETASPRHFDVPRSSASLTRILFIGDCMWEAEQLFPEIRKICHLDVLDLRAPISSAPDPRQAVVAAIEAHVKAIHDADPDLILFYLRPSLLSEEAFDVIRKRWSCPLLGMNLDDRVEFFPYGILRSGNDNYARWIHGFDVNLTSSLTAVDWYRARGAEVRHLPQGFCPDPRFLHAPDQADFAHALSFVGSWKPERGDLIARLSEHGIQPTIFGSGWPKSRWADDAQVIFRGSQLNLGIGYALASARIANAKGRDIECPATGACYLTTYHWELSQLFDIGKEVLCYRNAEELVELIGFYSRRPDACLAIARAAHRRAHREHTWEIRLRSLFKDLGFKPITT